MQLQQLSVTLEGSLVTAEGGHIVEPSAGERANGDLLGAEHNALVPTVKLLAESRLSGLSVSVADRPLPAAPAVWARRRDPSIGLPSTADIDHSGGAVDVETRVRCDGDGIGVLRVELEQFPPETPWGHAYGSGDNLVTCDGSAHDVLVTVIPHGPLFDAGRALARATLLIDGQTVATAERWLDLRA